MEGLGRLLVDHPFFDGIPDEDVQTVVGCARNLRFAPDTYLFHEGHSADEFYILRDGRVSLEIYVPNRGPLTLDTAGPGELVGTSWLFPPHRWELDARAIEPVRAFGFDGVCLRGKCDDNPRLGYLLMQRLSEVVHRRMHSAQLRLADLYGDVRVH